jgi:uncharacterized membrane protein YeiB
MGYDIARALAILAMIVVHFTLVMAGDYTEPAWLVTALGFLDGRAAAVFVILAGIGVTLMSRKAVASGDTIEIGKVRRVLVVRGLLLLLLGFLNLAIWPGDILRVYGVSLLVAAHLITASNRRLLLGSLGYAAGFVVLFLVLDFEEHWDWNTMTYQGLWTPWGLVRNLFYDGFRSVLPWTGYLLFGMWLGRLPLREPAVNSRVVLTAIGVAVAMEVLSALCVGYLRAEGRGLDEETITALFGTESMPALPLFLLASGGEAVAVIALCVRLAGDEPSRWLQPLAATGQMALTWYFAHIVLGLGGIVALDLESSQSLVTAAAVGVGFFALAVAISSLWRKAFRYGPLEAGLRVIANRL